MQCSVCLILGCTCFLDQRQVIKYFCGVSLVMYFVFYNYSNAGPERQAKIEQTFLPFVNVLQDKGTSVSHDTVSCKLRLILL